MLIFMSRRHKIIISTDLHSSQPNDLVNLNNYLPHHEMFRAFGLLPKVGQTGFIPVNKNIVVKS
jgi:hypothetical protein